MNSIIEEGTSIIQFLRRGIAQRQLETQLSAIIRTVAGHKKNKVPRGDGRYMALANVAGLKVQDFCLKYRIPESEIEAQIPALQELKNLATAPNRPSLVLGIPILVLSTALLIGVLGFISGFVRWLFTDGWRVAEALVRHL